jgi:hypothetical protein
VQYGIAVCVQLQSHAISVLPGLEQMPLPVLLQRDLPITVPDATRPFLSAGPTDGVAVCAFEEHVSPRDVVDESEMGDVQVADGPPRRVLAFATHAGAKERQLITDATPVCGLKISGVVPPFDAIVAMRPVITGKLEQPRFRNGLPYGGTFGVAGCGRGVLAVQRRLDQLGRFVPAGWHQAYQAQQAAFRKAVRLSVTPHVQSSRSVPSASIPAARCAG